jgi:hypothetical protein
MNHNETAEQLERMAGPAIDAEAAQDLANFFAAVRELADRATSNPEGVLARISQLCEFVSAGKRLRPNMGLGEVLARVDGEDFGDEDDGTGPGPYDPHGVREIEETTLPPAPPIPVTVTVHGAHVVVVVGGGPQQCKPAT